MQSYSPDVTVTAGRSSCGRRTALRLALYVALFAVIAIGIGFVGAAGATGEPTCSDVGYETDGGVYLVENVSQLQCIGDGAGPGLDQDYRLTGDIDASGTENWNGGDGFEPIGEVDMMEMTETPFTGSFDGDGHVISNVVVARLGEDKVGLFGVVGADGVVTNVSLENVDVEGGSRVGGLVGENRGEVSNSNATGSVDGAGWNVGGLIGRHDSGVVTNSSASVTVTGGGIEVGGLVGIINTPSEVRDSYADGDVTGNDDHVGGLTGNNAGVLKNSYAVGAVSGPSNVGGLVGHGSGTVVDSYWDTETTGQATSVGGTGLDTGQMQGSNAEGNMSGLDFENTWCAMADRDDYPRLRALDPCFHVTISGTDDPTTEGGTLTVEVIVGNDGAGAETQDITLTVDGTTEDAEAALTVASGASDTVTLEWETEPGDAGSYEIVVAAENDVATETIEVKKRFEVDASDGGTATSLSGRVVVDDALVLDGPDENLEAARVTIQNKQTGDELSVTDDHGISGVYDPNTGVLSLSGTASVTDYQDVLRTVTFENTDADGDTDTTDREITISLGGSVPSEGTDHYYEFVTDSGIHWNDARDAAAKREYFGLSGYLATITSQGENDFVAEKLDGKGWMGASDEDEEGTWRWVTGPEGSEDDEMGRHFWNQDLGEDGDGGPNGASAGGEYANWDADEPNNAGDEHYAHFLDGGKWNDYAIDNGNIVGYAVEYGGRADDPDVKLRDTKTVTLTDETPPTADAGDDQTVDEDTAVTLDGSRSSDNVDVTGYEWNYNDGGATDSGETPSHTFADPGTYSVELTVVDAAGNSHTDSVTVTVNDTTAPTAEAGDDRTVDEDTAVTFDGSGSTDNAGVVSYEWDFDGDGTSDSTDEKPSHTFADPGTGVVILVVEDDAGNEDIDTAVITVEDATAPLADAGDDVTVDEDTAFVLDGTDSSDNVGIVSYEWDVDGDGAYDLTGSEQLHTYDDPGVHTVTLRVTDDAGNSHTDTVEVTAADVTSPTAAAVVDGATTVNDTEAVSFNASGSTDNGGVTGYEWDFDGDGTVDSTKERPSHSFEQVAVHVVELTVEDAAGNTNTTSVEVTVEDRNVTASSIEYVGGTEPGTDPELRVFTAGGMLQVQLQNPDGEATTYDLTDIGAETDTEFEIDVTTEIVPRALIGAGDNTTWHVTDNGDGTYDVTIRTSPVGMQYLDGADLENWPKGDGDRADVGWDATVQFAIGDLEAGVDEEYRDALDGTIIATDAQAFGPPTYSPDGDGGDPVLSMSVAGPHLTVGDEENEGFVEATLPDALLDEWGVDDGDELRAAFDDEDADVSAEEVSGGIRLEFDTHYSAGVVEIAPGQSGGGGGSGGSGSSSVQVDEGEESSQHDAAEESDADGGSEPNVLAGKRSDDGTVEFEVSDPEGDREIVLDLTKDGDADPTDERDREVDGGGGGVDGTDGGDDSAGAADDTDRSNVAVDQLSIVPTGDGTREFDLSVREWEVDAESVEPDGSVSDGTERGATESRARDDPRSFLEATGSTAVGYVEVTHSNPDTDIDSVTFTFRVRKTYLDETGVGPSDVALYRDETDRWHQLPSEQVGESATHHVFEAESPGLSLFTIGSEQPAFEVVDVTVRTAESRVYEPVRIDALVRNLGGKAGIHVVDLRANGAVVATATVDVPARDTESVSLSFRPEVAGEHALTVDGTRAGVVDVVPDDDGSSVPLLGTFAAVVVLLAVVGYRWRPTRR